MGAGVSAVLALLALGPWGLRHVSFFRVRQVEIVGLRYLSPGPVVQALGLARDQNLFDPLGPIEARARALGGVLRVRVERRLPGTLHVTIVERPAIAFVPGPVGLVAVDAEGRPLPYDPAASGLDLPLVRRADPTVLRALDGIRSVDSTLYLAIESAGLARHGAVVMELAQRRLVVSASPKSDEIRAVGAVRRHLAATGRRYVELDASFAGWVIARRGRS